MPETMSHTSSTAASCAGTTGSALTSSTRTSGTGSAACAPASSAAAPCPPAAYAPTRQLPGQIGAIPRPRGTSSAGRAEHVHNRIGVDVAGGFYPAPHRYQLYLSADCPLSLRVSLTLGVLGLEDSVATTLLGLSADTSDAFAALRGAYEATWHHYDGPLTAPALCDRWTGRVVSNDTPDILRDLAGLAAGRNGSAVPALRPSALAEDIDALRELLDTDITPTARPHRRAAALELLDRQLAATAYALGEQLTAADIDLWVALVHLETPDAVSPYAHLPHLSDYVRRLDAHPAFHARVPRPDHQAI
jgi:putative glutathione S-transferase